MKGYKGGRRSLEVGVGKILSRGGAWCLYIKHLVDQPGQNWACAGLKGQI